MKIYLVWTKQHYLYRGGRMCVRGHNCMLYYPNYMTNVRH